MSFVEIARCDIAVRIELLQLLRKVDGLNSRWLRNQALLPGFIKQRRIVGRKCITPAITLAPELVDDAVAVGISRHLCTDRVKIIPSPVVFRHRDALVFQQRFVDKHQRRHTFIR